MCVASVMRAPRPLPPRRARLFPGCLRSPFLKSERRRVPGPPGTHPCDSGRAACPRPALREQPATARVPEPALLVPTRHPRGPGRARRTLRRRSSGSVPRRGGRALLLQKRGPSRARVGPRAARHPPPGPHCRVSSAAAEQKLPVQQGGPGAPGARSQRRGEGGRGAGVTGLGGRSSASSRWGRVGRPGLLVPSESIRRRGSR